MALFRRFFYRKPPEGLLEISEKVFVFDCCFSTDVLEDDEYKGYIGGIVGQLRDYCPDSSFMVFNFGQGENQSCISSILSEFDMTVMDYPQHYENCPLLTMEMIHHFLRSSESWLSLSQRNVLLMHCEWGGWPVLAFMLAALLIYRNLYTGEQKTLDVIYKQAPRELLQLMMPLNPLPSQLRYLQYVSRRNVAPVWPPLDRALTLDCVILRVIPNLDGKGGCRPLFRIYGQDPFMADRTPKLLFSTPKRSKIVSYYKQADCEPVKIDIHCHVQGDVVLECISLDDDLEREEMMFRVMFNTAFIRSNILMLKHDEIDTSWNVKDQFPKEFRTEFLFSDMSSTSSLTAVDFPANEEKGPPIKAFAKVTETPKSLALNCASTPQDLILLTKKIESPELQVSLKRPAQSKILSQQITQTSLSYLASDSDSLEGFPGTTSGYCSVPSLLGITALLHDEYKNKESAQPLTRSSTVSSTPLKASIVTVPAPPRPPPLFQHFRRAEANMTTSLDLGLPTPMLPPQPPPPSANHLSVPEQLFSSIHKGPVNSRQGEQVLAVPPPLPPFPPLMKSSFSMAYSPLSERVQSPTVRTSFTTSPPVHPPLPSSSKITDAPYIKCTSSTPPPPPPPPASVSSEDQSTAVKVSSSTPPPPPPPTPPAPVSSEDHSTAVKVSSSTPLPPPPPPPGIFSSTNCSIFSPLPVKDLGVVSFPPPRPPPVQSSVPIPGLAVKHSAPPPPPPPSSTTKDSITNYSSPVPPPPVPCANGGPSLEFHSAGSKGSLPQIPGPPLIGKGRLPSCTSLKNQAQPRKTSLKPYHWLKLTRAVQGSLWAEAQKSDGASKAPEFDMSELESLFSASLSNSDLGSKDRRSSRRASGPKSNKVHLIELRRAYNCEIMLSKVKVPLPDLMSSVLALDELTLDVDQVDNLIKFCPTKEEMELLKNYNGDKENLGKCEQFVLELMKVPRVGSKLRVFSFKIQFRLQISDLQNNLNIVNSTSEEIRNSIKLKRIMQIILSLGNALNHGTARGSAVGFRLDSLLKLTDTRSRNNRLTLMHYLCKVLAEKFPELLDFQKDLVSLEASTQIQLKYLAEEMQAITKGLEKVVQELSASENDGPASECFCKTLKEFLRFAEAEVRSLASLYSEVGRKADALALYFGEDPARCPFEQVVSTLLNFVRMFNHAHEENCKQLEFEKKRAIKEAENESKVKFFENGSRRYEHEDKYSQEAH